MEISIFFAQFWGWLLFIMATLALLAEKNALRVIFKSANEPTFVLLTGYLALILGLCTVLLHNVWIADWRIAVTLFGWISLVKGIVRIGFPEWVKKVTSFFFGKTTLIRTLLVLCALIGIGLVIVGR